MLFRFLFLFSAAFLLAWESQAALLDKLADSATWDAPITKLIAGFPKHTYITRVDSKAVRIPQQPGFEAGGFSHGDVLLRWNEESTLHRAEIIVYNKGDDGELSQDEFKAKLKSVETALNTLLAIPGKKRRMDKRDTGVKGQSVIWETPDCGTWLLESSASGRGKKFNSEFIRLTIGTDVEKGGAADASRRSTLPENVTQEDDGTVWLKNIPMVDQGEKGYCVPATVSRVLAYYGMDGVDQHAMAALCKSGFGGTTMPQMRAALQDLGRAFHFRVRTMEDCTIPEMIGLYNKEAKKRKAMQLTPQSVYFFSFDADIMRFARMRNASKVKKWKAEIKKSIDEGVPILWCVMLGIFKEQGLPQSNGGHMRLIIGYNEENETIIYSDSWGAAHARKEMPMSDAFSMTVERNVLRLSR